MRGLAGFTLALAGGLALLWKWKKILLGRKRLRVVRENAKELLRTCFPDTIHLEGDKYACLADWSDSSEISVGALPWKALGEHPGEAHGGAHMGAGLQGHYPAEGGGGHGRRAHSQCLPQGWSRGGHDEQRMPQWCAPASHCRQWASCMLGEWYSWTAREC